MAKNEECGLAVRIRSLLEEGHTIPRSAKLCGCSESYVRKIAKILVRSGHLEPLSKYNATFQKKVPIHTTPPVVGSNRTDPPHQPMLPANVGAVFAIVEQPKGLQRNLGGMAYTEEKHFFNAQWGRHKCQIWLHGGFKGGSPQEILANAKETLLGVAARLEAKYAARLTHLRWMERVEWVDFNEKRSAEIARGAKLEKGGIVEVAGAYHKFSDFSHPDKVQFNIKQKPEIPTDHASIHHYIYSGGFARDLKALGDRDKAVVGILEKLTETVQEIRQRMDMEAKK